METKEKILEAKENILINLVKEFKKYGYGKQRIYSLIDVSYDNIKTLNSYT